MEKTPGTSYKVSRSDPIAELIRRQPPADENPFEWIVRVCIEARRQHQASYPPPAAKTPGRRL